MLLYPNTLGLASKTINRVGWIEGSETQQTTENVGFRSSTQPTILLNPSVLSYILMFYY